MPTRTTLLAFALLLLVPWPATAQVAAPSQVDDEREGPDARPPPPPPKPAARSAPERPIPPGTPAATANQVGREQGPPPNPGAAGVPDTLPAPPPPPPAPPPERPAPRTILPVQAAFGSIHQRWAERRLALREQDPTRAAAATNAVLAIKRELAIENLFAFAASEAREAARAVEANLVGDALAHAELAVALAPDLADGHLALARTRLKKNPADPRPALAALGDALQAAFREPHSLRAFQADLFVALAAALLAGAGAVLLLLLARSLRLFLHDVHHLPLLSGSAAIQAGFLGLVLLATPIAFGLGIFPAIATAAAASWLYLSNRERVVVTLALLLVAGLPWAAQATLQAAAWTGTLAETVHDLEHGAPDDAEVARLEAAWPGATPTALSTALGRHHKRRGELAAARRWYEQALKDGAGPEAQVDLGNVLFLEGDLDGAKAAYLSAADRAAGELTVQAAAHYDLSKLYLRGFDIEKSSAARDRAEQEDGAFLRRHGDDADFSANRYLVDLPVPYPAIQALAAGDAMPDAIREALRSRLAGVLGAASWPWAPLGLLGALWIAGLLAGRLAPSQRCQKCGRPACRRCDPGGGPLCGQCVNVYVKKGLVEARDRLRKDALVRRHAHIQKLVVRVLGVLTGGAGHVWGGWVGRGFMVLVALFFVGFMLWFWRGIMPPPQPTPYLLAGKLLVGVPVALLVYLVALRDLFRRTDG